MLPATDGLYFSDNQTIIIMAILAGLQWLFLSSQQKGVSQLGKIYADLE